MMSDSTTSVYFYLAIPTPNIDDTVLESIQRLTNKAETTPLFKEKLENLLIDWPTICSKEVGHSNIVKHRIITTDELPVRKRAYKLSIAKQKFVDNEIQELLDKKKKSYNHLFPHVPHLLLLLSPRRMEVSDCALIIEA